MLSRMHAYDIYTVTLPNVVSKYWTSHSGLPGLKLIFGPKDLLLYNIVLFMLGNVTIVEQREDQGQMCKALIL